MNKQEQAIKYFRDHFNCSQAVFTVFGKELGLSEDTCLKLSCGFGGGMGRQQKTCGAVTGAMIVLGLKYGKAIGDPEEKKAETYSKVRQLSDEFKNLHGSTCCFKLLNGLDMNDPDENKEIQRLNLFEVNCEKYVRDSVAITEKLMK